jgi:hypothetical protein
VKACEDKATDCDDRVKVLKSLLTVCRDLVAPCEDKATFCARVKAPIIQSSYFEGIRDDAYEGVDGSTMFPGPDGVVKAMGEQVLWDTPKGGK